MLSPRSASAALALFAIGARALSQEYCSDENTGSDYSVVSNIYNSNLACQTQCEASYAFAIVQWQSCWCSNTAPSEQQSVSKCDENCPGYPDDSCGNQAEGLFGYIALSISPSGTAGAVASSSTEPSSTSKSVSLSALTRSPSTSSSAEAPISSSSSSTSPPSETSISVDLPLTSTSTQSSAAVLSTSSTSSTQVRTSSSSTSTISSSSSTSSTTSPTSTYTTYTVSTTSTPVVAVPITTSSSTPASTRSRVVSVEVVTRSGAVVTQTVTSTPINASGESQSADARPTAQRKSLSGGAIAGIVIGVLLGLAAIALGAFLLRRRRQQTANIDGAADATGKTQPRRNISVLSKTGLLSQAGAQNMVERDDEALYVNTHTGNNSVRHSMIFGGGAAHEGVSPSSPLGSTGEASGSRRNSKPLVYDQRLNPSALFANAEANGSRVSMQDQQDYSRPLGITNPDLRTSVDSRLSHG